MLDERALRFRLATVGVNRQTYLEVYRKGDPLTLTMRLVLPPDEPHLAPRRLRGKQPLSGAVVGDVSPAMAQRYGLEDVWDGVIVLEVPGNSAARRFGLRPGDIVRELNGTGVVDADALERQLDEPVKRWLVVIERDGALRRIDVTR